MIVKLAAIRYAKSRNYNKKDKKSAAWILPKSAVGDFGHSLMKRATLVVKKIPKADDALEEQLDNANKVVHVSRPDPGRIKSPIRLIENK